jgi:signal peptidase I
MEPTYPPRTTVAYDPSRTSPIIGDVVLFRMPENALERGCGDNPPPQHACQESRSGLSATLALGRVVGVGGDSLAFKEGDVVLNGQLQRETSTKPCGDGPVCTFQAPIVVPGGAYYVLYDNRAMLDDSRVWGAIPRAAILGTVTGIR